MKRNSIVFFCNAGADDGLGHLMRCLSFADAVKGVKKSSIYFFSNDFEGIVKDRVTSNGYKFKEITNKWINEHYSSFKGSIPFEELGTHFEYFFPCKKQEDVLFVLRKKN